METRAHHILIGLFTVLIAAAAIGFALWLGQADNGKRYHRYDVVFNEAVTGLSNGGAVQFNGIKVGEVVDLRLDPRDPRRVLARIRVESDAPIRNDTRARLVMTGITGISVIRLSSGDDPQSKPLLAKDDEVPVIIATPSPFSKLLADGEDVMLNANELLIEMRKLLSAENTSNVARTLRNLEQTTSTIAAERDNLRVALKQIAEASQQASVAMTEASRVMTSANTLIDGSGRQALESAQRSMASFEKSMQNIDQLIADNRDQLNGGMRGLSDLGPAIAELRTTLASLRLIARRLEDKPADYLLGNQQVKEFQP